MSPAAFPTVKAVFRACADPLRLRILAVLRSGETCVGDLVTVLGVPQPTASRHLAYLKRAGLVRSRSERSWSFYALAPSASRFHRKLLECLDSCTEEMPELKKDIEKAARLKRSGGCCPL